MMESVNDLFMASEKKEYWINIFRINIIQCTSIPFHSREDALNVRKPGIEYLGDPVKIWEEEV